MMRTGLPGKPCGSAADGLAISASAARATAHANPPALDRPMPCAPSAILARRAHGAISTVSADTLPPVLTCKLAARVTGARMIASPLQFWRLANWFANAWARDRRARERWARERWARERWARERWARERCLNPWA